MNTTSPQESSDREAKRKDKRISINDRRGQIVRHLRGKGMISLATLTQISTSSENPRTVEADIAFLNDIGFSIETVESEGRRYLVDAQARHIGAKTARMELHASAKQHAAMAACALILGLPDRSNASAVEPADTGSGCVRATPRDRLQQSNPELLKLWTAVEIKNSLLEGHRGLVAYKQAVDVYSKLKRIWDETNITVFCDAGTTIDRMGSILKDVFLPTAFSPLSNLQVCTNSRALFNLIADAEVCAKAIITGGCQLGVDGATDSIAGSFTEAWLRATGGVLRFAMSFIGCTVIDVGCGYLLSDSYEEKTVKELVMHSARTGLRILVVDRAKFQLAPIREGFRFAALTPENVDLIVTNAPSKALDAKEQEGDSAAPLIQRIRDVMGIPVIESEIEPFAQMPALDILSGREMRVRVPQPKLDDMLLGLGLANKHLGVQTKFVSHSVELFIAAAMKLFTEDRQYRDKLLDLFNELRSQTFLDWNDVNPEESEARLKRDSHPPST